MYSRVSQPFPQELNVYIPLASGVNVYQNESDALSTMP
jgi:hypothetical protein